MTYINDYTLVNYNRDELQKIMFSEEVSHKRAHIVWSHLYKIIRIGKSAEAERLVGAQGWGKEKLDVKGKWGLATNEYKFSVGNDANILKLVCGDAYILCTYTKEQLNR